MCIRDSTGTARLGLKQQLRCRLSKKWKKQVSTFCCYLMLYMPIVSGCTLAGAGRRLFGLPQTVPLFGEPVLRANHCIYDAVYVRLTSTVLSYTAILILYPLM